MTEKRKLILKRKLQESRFRIRQLNRGFSLPLDEMIFVAVNDVYRMSTNGKCIFFDAEWLMKLDNTSLDFILCHQLMHISIYHIHRPKYFAGERFHLACDIIANSNLERLGWKYDSLKNIGKIYYETFFPAEVGRDLTVKEALAKIPFDPATMDDKKKCRYMIDFEKYWGKEICPDTEGIIVLCPEDEDEEFFVTADTIGGEHLFFKKEDFVGYYNGEENNNSHEESERVKSANAFEAVKLLRVMMDRSSAVDNERKTNLICFSNLDWKKLLNCMMSEEMMDYSFLPPDRRMQDSEFFMPDFNVSSDEKKKILFWIDTSGSIEDDVLSSVYSEIYNATMQLEGNLFGMLGFFDTEVTPPMPFCSVSELISIVPKGGGGTDFDCVFRYMNIHMIDEEFSNVVIFTDGMAEFPNKNVAKNFRVIWLFSQKGVEAPWGKWAYVDIKKNNK